MLIFLIRGEILLIDREDTMLVFIVVGFSVGLLIGALEMVIGG